MESKKPQKEGFGHDLVADLRNRRLIPVIIALIAAIIAVPILISGPEADESSEAVSAAGSIALDPAADSEAFPAVLAQQPVLRDTKTRLDNFKKKNPFKQQLTGPTKREQRAIEKAMRQEQQAQAASGGGGGGLSAGSATGSGAAGSPDLSSGSSGSSSGELGSSSGVSGSSSPAGSGGGGSSDPQVEEGVIVFTYEVDVKVGPLGKTREQKGVKQLDFLPNDSTRVFQFVKSDFDGTEAVFAVNPDAKELEGDGTCKPKKKTCELVTLKQGEEHKFRYEPNGKTYRLKVTKVIRNSEFVPADEVDDLRAAGSFGG